MKKYDMIKYDRASTVRVDPAMAIAASASSFFSVFLADDIKLLGELDEFLDLLVIDLWDAGRTRLGGRSIWLWLRERVAVLQYKHVFVTPGAAALVGLLLRSVHLVKLFNNGQNIRLYF